MHTFLNLTTHEVLERVNILPAQGNHAIAFPLLRLLLPLFSFLPADGFAGYSHASLQAGVLVCVWGDWLSQRWQVRPETVLATVPRYWDSSLSHTTSSELSLVSFL